MFTRTVDFSEGLLMEENGEALLLSNAPEDLHSEHVVVGRNGAPLEDRCPFELVRSHFLVASGDGDTQAPQGLLYLVDELEGVAWKRSEIVVAELLGLSRVRSLQSPSSGDNVRTAESEALLNDKEFLLNTRIPVGG